MAADPRGVLVVNASPLIHLAEAGRLDLLRDAGANVWVPESVAREIRAFGVEDLTARVSARPRSSTGEALRRPVVSQARQAG